MHVNLISCPGTRSIKSLRRDTDNRSEEKLAFARLCSNERNEGKKKKKKKRTKGEERYIVFCQVQFSAVWNRKRLIISEQENCNSQLTYLSKPTVTDAVFLRLCLGGIFFLNGNNFLNWKGKRKYQKKSED